MNNKYLINNKNLMKEWNWKKNNTLGLNPNILKENSSIKAWWTCENNHTWECSINARIKGGKNQKK